MQNSQNSSQMPWWHKEKVDTLPDRIKAIQHINDPTTYADEVLKASKILLTLLLCFTGLLGALSYFKSFEVSFPPEACMFMAISLTIVIEWGKNYAATRAVRIPFFHGMNFVTAAPSNTFIFLGLVGVAAATFTMSIYNSTKGGEQLAMMLSHEKNEKVFAPDTKEIDAQIAAISGNVSNAPRVKWKGKNYYQDPKSVRAANNSLELLQRQRETSVINQRADYERNLAVKASQSNFSSSLVLKSGGWVELLQILLIVLRVACERSLYSRAYPTPASSPIGSSRTGATQPATAPIGFNVSGDGNVRSTGNAPNRDSTQNPVTQRPQSVTQPNASVFLSPEEALVWFESELRKEPSHFDNKHARNETVINRIANKLNRAERYLDATPDDSIPAKSAERFSSYLADTLFPLLHDRNYKPDTRIIDLLNAKKGTV